jgi:hypothetical protein
LSFPIPPSEDADYEIKEVDDGIGEQIVFYEYEDI